VSGTTQVVAGMAYRLDFTLSDGSEFKAHIIRQLNGDYQLVDWAEVNADHILIH